LRSHSQVKATRPKKGEYVCTFDTEESVILLYEYNGIWVQGVSWRLDFCILHFICLSNFEFSCF